MIEKITLTKIGPYKDHWALIYVDPNNTYSAGGGRITIVLDDYVGSAFFSHVGQATFKEFIAQCNSDYLIGKLFKVGKWIPVENGNELIEYVAREHMDAIKEHRSSGTVSKAELRSIYDELLECEFSDKSHLYDKLLESDRKTIEKILGEDWWWDLNASKPNQLYAYLESMITDVISEFKKVNEVVA